MKKSTRYLSMLLVLVMMLGVIPAISFASSAEESTDITPYALITRGDDGQTVAGLTDGNGGIAVDISWNLNNNPDTPTLSVMWNLTLVTLHTLIPLSWFNMLKAVVIIIGMRM